MYMSSKRCVFFVGVELYAIPFSTHVYTLTPHLIDHILNRKRFGHFGEQKLPLACEDFFRRFATDMMNGLLMIGLRRNGRI